MSGGGGARVSIAGGLKKTIQDIREIAGEHSDEDIFSMLKECSMDPNETAHRLLHLDTFHEVKKKHGKRKENVVIKASDVPGKQLGARVSRGAKVGGGNYHSQNKSQSNARRSFGGNKENGYANVSKGPKSENKTAAEVSRSVHVKSSGKSIQEEAPLAMKADDSSLPAHGGKPSAVQLTPASIFAEQEKLSWVENHVGSSAPVVPLQPLASISTEAVDIDETAPSKSVHENLYAMSNGKASCSIDNTKNVVPHTRIVGNQLTVINIDDQACQKGVPADGTIDCAEKPVSEEEISDLNEEASKLALSDASDGHVVFPEHLQVPEAFKKKLTFGSFSSSWPLDVKHTSDDSVASTNMPLPADDSSLVKSVAKPSVESSESMASTVKEAQKRENTSYLESPLPTSNDTPLHERGSSDIVIKIDEPETESLLSNEGSNVSDHPSNHVFGYAPKPQIQSHDSAEPQGGNFITSSVSGVDQNSHSQAPGATHDTLSSPPPGHFLRQTYHPNLFPYGHYYPQFFAPQVQQYVTHGGFPHQPLVPNVYLTSPAAGGIKYPYQQQKQGSNTGIDGYIGVPSGYNPYVPYAFPYCLPPVVVPGNVAGEDDHSVQLKENAAPTTKQQTESSGEWIGGTGRTVPGMQVNPFYNLNPGQGHPLVFPPTPTGFGPFGGVYHHPSLQPIPPPQLAMHSHNQQPHSMASAEPPAAAAAAATFYQP